MRFAEADPTRPREHVVRDDDVGSAEEREAFIGSPRVADRGDRSRTCEVGFKPQETRLSDASRP